MGRVDRELIWIVAQPSLGKTAMILQWAIMLGGQGHTVAIASLESQRDALGSRAIANVGPLDNFTIRQRRAGSETIAAAYDAAHRIPDTIRIADNKMTIDQVYAWGKSEVRRGAVMLIIDNTRHIHVRGNVDRVNEVAEISAKTKQLRDETHVPVVVLHHSKIDAKSGAEDVSWCKDIEKDADVMVFLKADPDNSVAPNTENDPGVWAVRWFVKKNRESRADYEILLRFLKQYQLFEEWDKPAGAQRNDYDQGW
jgi:replicative DNA helicase